ncbi:substrate-binding periplasmic protein [Aestuariispira insulae]|uniref:Polar amino acid transport system substrate-binding protein n=1 Tax=Aestuariispira insulae TaxID=1461337 RepID=A0A3D9HW03_9PROT|nr:transporter substrate-binding domain-containing protein [Aestuariispira insulae]RED53668.1 polar amino acid transport system substrate-binding protein [Aestuariispira insulae]
MADMRLIKETMVCLTFICLLFGPGKPYADAIEIHTTHYPPFEIENATDGRPGFDVEVVAEAFRRMQIKTDIRYTPWKRVVVLAEAGSIPAFFSCTYSIGRAHFSVLSIPISQLTPVIALRKDQPGGPFNTLDSIRELRVVGLRGYSYEQELTNLGIPHSVLTADDQALKHLTIDRADAFYTALENAAYLAKQLGLSDQLRYDRLEDREQTLFHLCFSNRWPGYERLLAGFNSSLKGMLKDGTVQTIHDRYR